MKGQVHKEEKHFCVLRRTWSISYRYSTLKRFQAVEVRDFTRESLEATLVSSNSGWGKRDWISNRTLC